MSEEWRTDKPEVGMVAWLEVDGRWSGPAICQESEYNEGELVWCMNDGNESIAVRWRPIVTYEEARLQARLVKLGEENWELKREVCVLHDNLMQAEFCHEDDIRELGEEKRKLLEELGRMG